MAEEFHDSQPTSTPAPTCAGTTVTSSTNPSRSEYSTSIGPTNSTNTVPRFDETSSSPLSKMESDCSENSESSEQIEPIKIAPSATPMTSSSSTNVPINSVPINSTNVTLSREIGFVDSSPLSRIELSDCSNSFFGSSRQNQTSYNSPPITTQIRSGTNYEITPSEMKSLTTALKRTKMVINRSKSKYIEKQKLTALLEEIFGFVIATRSKMSQVQANFINDYLKDLMTRRRKIDDKKRRKTAPTGCLFIFLIIIMLLRMIADIFCAILISRSKLLPLKVGLLAGDVLGFVLTGFTIVSFCYKSSIRMFEIFFCIIWTMLYGILATMVHVHLPEHPPMIAICGYVSMVTCIIQGCSKFCDNSRPTNRRYSCDDIKLEETDNKKNIADSTANTVLTQNHPIKNINNVSWNANVSTDKNLSLNHVDPRIEAIKNLENTIKNFLIEINGSNYVNQAKFNSVEEINYNQQYQSNNYAIPNKIMTPVVVNEAGTSNYATTNATTYNSTPIFADPSCFWCCYSSNPHHDCLPAWYCFGCDGCCDCDHSCEGDCCGDCSGCCECSGDCCSDGCTNCADCVACCADCGACADCLGCCVECAAGCSA